MASSYTRTALLQKIDEAAKNMPTFYQQGFVNYRGKTSDTDEYYTEIVAEWCCNHLQLFDRIPVITREQSYRVAGRDGVPEQEGSNRVEERIAMAMFRQGRLPLVGEIKDYQTPLKNKRNDRVGKIDLLAYDGSILRILELKEPESDETMLRCVLEGYTYLRTVNTKKLVLDFALPEDTPVEASPFVFKGKRQYSEAKEHRPQLDRLMQLMNSKAYYISGEMGNYFVEV